MKDKKKFWTVKNLTTNKGELILYGPISQSSWWGDEITPKQFADDLKALGDIDELDVRINSGGGDVFAAHAISSLLKSNKAKVNVYIDGLAASAATIIVMAGDKVYIPSSAMMMIHNPLVSLWGMYNTQDFEELTGFLEKVKDSIVNAYHVKTGIDKEELSRLMDEETWMTGEEAVKMGFADELLDGVDVEAYQNGNFMFFNSIKVDISGFKNAPKLQQNNTATKRHQVLPNTINFSKKGEDEMLTLEDLKNKYPEIYNQVYQIGLQDGVKNERERMKAIDSIAIAGFEKEVEDAKYNTGITAEQLAVNLIKASKEKGAQYLAALREDTNTLNDIEGDGAPVGGEDENKEIEKAANKMASFINKRRGVK